MSRTLVIGVGNLYRHDDGAGLAVIEHLRAEAPPLLELVEESGEPVALVQRWSGWDRVVLVDAVSSGSTAGRLHRFECIDGHWDLAPPMAAVSTHGMGVAEAVELAGVLGRLPRHLVLYGVEVDDVSEGVGLSPAVAGAVATLADDLAAAARAASRAVG